MSFSSRLTELQTSRNLKKQDIYNAIGITRIAYYYYEKDMREPTLSILIALADFFDVSLDYLTGRTDNPKINR